MEKLREIRMKEKLTYEQLAKQLGISKAYYWQIENNKRGLSYKMATKIAEALNTKPDFLFFDEFKKRS